MAESYTNSIIVNRPLAETFALWEDFELFPHFMKYLRSVRKTGQDTSHWAMETVLGRDLEWDARTTVHEPLARIAWQSLRGDVETTGEVTFKTVDNNQTSVTVTLAYEPVGGKIQKAIRKAVGRLFHNPQEMLEEDLKNFKAYAEEMVIAES